MARAGFYPIESGKISFRRDGNWYSDDERIDNPRIALLFSRSIKRSSDGSYYLQVAEGHRADHSRGCALRHKSGLRRRRRRLHYRDE